LLGVVGTAPKCQFQTHAVQQIEALFDHLVGEDVELRQDGQAERVGGLAVITRLNLVAGLGTLHNLINEGSGTPVKLLQAISITHETAHLRVLAISEHRWKAAS
jgi:hypothetical protein